MKKDYTPIFGLFVILAILVFAMLRAGNWSDRVTEESELIISQRDKDESQFNLLRNEVTKLQRNRDVLESFVSSWSSDTKIDSSIFAGTTLNTLAVKHTVAAAGGIGKSSSVPFRTRTLEVDIIGKEVTGPFHNVISYLDEVMEMMPQVRWETVKMRHVKGGTVSAEFNISFPSLDAFGSDLSQN